MVKLIDDFLNGITQYRLMLYFLVFLLALAVVLAFFNVLPFGAFNLLFSAAFLIVVCWVVNKVFAKVFRVPTNLESVYITALILTLIITPARSLQDIFLLTFAAVLSQSSKYLLAICKKHIFNPAALGAAFLFILKGGASWWVGNPWMIMAVVLGGLLVVRKLRKFSLVLSFLAVFLAINLGSGLQITIAESPVLFFVFVMLTEPLTTPPKKNWQIIYGSLVGLLFAPNAYIGSFYITPEVVLLFGNLFSYIVSPKERLLLKLKEKNQIAPDIYDFIFERSSKNETGKNFVYAPGQYMEWTLAHKNPDSRGVRRYFTIASSPTESNLRIGVKFYPNGSSFKKSLLAQNPGSEILAGQLSGEFILPKDPDKKLCFIAGGIGITPYRSIIKFLLDTDKRRDIILFYSNKTEEEIVYKDFFERARQRMGIKTVYVVTEKMGYINGGMIRKEAPDFKNRIFYISGPHSMVDTFEKTLKGMGVSGQQIKVDFFPGYV